MQNASTTERAVRAGARRWVRPLAVAAVGAALLTAAACGGGDDEPTSAASTTDATTSATTAPTTTAPATTAPATTAPAGAGDAAVGEQVFQQTCAGCHAGGGTKAGIGPQLSGAGLTPAKIRSILENGQNQMPAGLVEGQELADVVAYVASLQ